MAKKSVWVWVGIVAAVLFLFFGLCVCSILGYTYWKGQQLASAKEKAQRARSLIRQADQMLGEAQGLSAAFPSNSTRTRETLKATAELSDSESKLSEAKSYLQEAIDTGAGGTIEEYAKLALDSTDVKVKLIGVRKRQRSELAKAATAAGTASAAFSAMNKGSNDLHRAIPLRNADKYRQASKLRRSGEAQFAKALTLYRQADRQYPACDFSAALTYISRVRQMQKYEAQLDSLGIQGRLSTYNKIVPKANAAQKRAGQAWSAAASRGTSAEVDRAYTAETKDWADEARAKSVDAGTKDARAQQKWASI